MRVVVFGCGSMGTRHVRNLRALGQDVGVYDPQMARFAPELDGVEVYPDEEIAAHRADVGVIAAPARDHLRLIMALGNKPTFVEKPLSDSYTTIPYWVAQFAGHSAQIVQVGYQLRCSEPAIRMKEALPTIGRPLSAQFYVGTDIATWPGRTYADALLECSHEIDAARWMLGECECVGAAQNGDTWDLLLRHVSGCLSTVHLSTQEPRQRRFWDIQGSEGNLVWQWAFLEGCTSFVAQYGGGWVWSGDAIEANEAAYKTEIEQFVAACLGNGPVPCTLDDGLAVMTLCEQARRRAR